MASSILTGCLLLSAQRATPVPSLQGGNLQPLQVDERQLSDFGKEDESTGLTTPLPLSLGAGFTLVLWFLRAQRLSLAGVLCQTLHGHCLVSEPPTITALCSASASGSESSAGACTAQAGLQGHLGTQVTWTVQGTSLEPRSAFQTQCREGFRCQAAQEGQVTTGLSTYLLKQD